MTGEEHTVDFKGAGDVSHSAQGWYYSQESTENRTNMVYIDIYWEKERQLKEMAYTVGVVDPNPVTGWRPREELTSHCEV